MICNLYTDSMQQSKHNFFEQNHLLMKFRRKIVVHWARLPSKISITKEMRETESVHKLHYMLNKNYLQHVGLVSSRQRRKVHWMDRMGCTFLDFHQMSESDVRDCCIRMRMMFWNRSKHPSAWAGCLTAPVQVLTHRPQRRPFSWRVTWKSDCSHLQEARYKLVSCTTSLVVQDTEIQGRWAGARCAAWRHAFRNWVGEF
jgi:hypothetical protein